MNCAKSITSMFVPLFVAGLALTACSDDGSGSATDTAGTTDGTSTVAPTTSVGDTPATASTGDEPTTSGTTSETPTGTTGDPSTGEPVETTQIRVVHLSPGAPAVDVFANGDGAAPVIDALAVKNSITVTVPAGDYEFAVSATGTPIDAAVVTVPKLTYEANKVYTVVALGQLTKGNFEIIRIENDPTGLDPAQIRLQVTHAASAAAFAEVDVWAGASVDALAELIPDFKFKSSGTADVGPVDLSVALDIDNDAKPDAVWAIPGASLAPAVGAVVNVFAYSDETDIPSLQVVAFDGATIQLDPV